MFLASHSNLKSLVKYFWLYSKAFAFPQKHNLIVKNIHSFLNRDYMYYLNHKVKFIIFEYFLYKHTTLINICGIFVQI